MKIKSFTNVVIITGLFISFQAHAFDSKTDLSTFNIRGLYLGMPTVNALGMLNNYNPPLRVTKSESDISVIRGSRLRGLKFLLSSSAKQIKPGSKGAVDNFDLIFSPPNNPDTVMGIGRSQILGYQALISDMKALFTKKYGKPAFVSRPSIGKGISTYTLSWSLKPNGKPQKDEAMLKHCFGAQNVLLHANAKANNRLNFQQCGFTFIVNLYTNGLVSYNANTTISSYTAILYDGNSMREAVGRTIAYSEKIAKKLDAEKMKKIKGAKMPQL